MRNGARDHRVPIFLVTAYRCRHGRHDAIVLPIVTGFGVRQAPASSGSMRSRSREVITDVSRRDLKAIRRSTSRLSKPGSFRPGSPLQPIRRSR